ncbi:dihydropteroate synthase [Clostridium sp. SYSU_GA19001]|uniref:dihydropteroate synthase n=1 Tax=Clostridium caldaquaticum TaxID=2940653 RepID=UPI0020774803|nr:dihydropteroate synthase [Clostridium caldaquaticum]MCM8710925.1 dihydropteroate synthase [Clostridium caldaquaticum]
MKIGNKEFVIGERTYIMGILNVTPDSFSDGGKYNSIQNALNHAKTMIEEGVDIIDIGGESTRPNHTAVEAEEEINRVIPIIKAIRKESDIPISIDTYKGKVAELAIKAGASLINDVWGFKKDPYMSEVAAKYNVPCCLMHNRDNTYYNNLIDDIFNDLNECIQIAIKAGVKKENIILDPGIGFGKTLEQNLKVMNNLHRFKELNFPLLLGTSRKSMIGNTLNLPVDKRVEGTIATSVLGVINGFSFIRVHDVKENLRAVKMTEAIMKAGV